MIQKRSKIEILCRERNATLEQKAFALSRVNALRHNTTPGAKMLIEEYTKALDALDARLDTLNIEIEKEKNNNG